MVRGGDVAAGGIGCIVFAYIVLLRLPVGIPRLVALLPWIVLLYRSAWDVPTIHLRAVLSFFFLWMIPSKLLLLCWNLGAVQDPSVTASFPRFFAAMALSINIPRSLIDASSNAAESNAAPAPDDRSAPISWKSSWIWLQESLAWQAVIIRASIKVLLVVLLFSAYAFRDRGMPELLLYLIYSLHIYLACSLIFEAIAAIAAATIGVKLEPQFDKPFLTATMAVFLVSGLMHEVIFLYTTKSTPTWQVTGFFLVNGLAMVVEVALRRNFGPLVSKLPKVMCVVITLGFIFTTASLLFFPPLQRPGTCFQALDEFEQMLGALLAVK
ncbi:acyl-CoA--sterol O-acyltransferase 1 isoform X2 [Selaginella moellendorffii]|uniref:acyl-CoA--sterol O-acyltransferase 1 isoform X2 n=1 Tax=Selaginella moellendorffii TaxID=88036 RepID=UPI000D1CB35A|nr:acyl-CoA--sterol O-acyltransferase 1 isoform X2 [Selaginella moellendorffii]|eukprot:XP_024544687.1 acyl-CoA--sterol O-acyltransferase 1 isoform X2 [Selaginella moellendorffii]